VRGFMSDMKGPAKRSAMNPQRRKKILKCERPRTVAVPVCGKENSYWTF